MLIEIVPSFCRDWEEKEALLVESDVWHSKFLASTLIVGGGGGGGAFEFIEIIPFFW
jgi:hypothetical protein